MRPRKEVRMTEDELAVLVVDVIVILRGKAVSDQLRVLQAARALLVDERADG